MPFSDKDSARSGVRARLLNLIHKLSDDQLLMVLKKIEEMPFKENRKQLRKRYPLNIGFRVQDHKDEGKVHDISYSGVFIETGASLSIGSEIILEFSVQGIQEPLRISGEIARKSPRGIGVKFSKLSNIQADIIKNMVDSC